ncbi:MAG: hypothetical protein KGQ88_09625, partial [Chloroflexi bacterium]|nr:hypothetical protein [Chloroflexota bacterium]
MKGLLEGRRFGFALRPWLGNVALGLGLAVTILDLGSWVGLGTRDTSALVVGAYWLCLAAAVVALLALFTALAELRDVPEEDTMLARLDAGGMLVTIVLYGASAALRSTDLGAAGAAPLPFLMAVAGLLVLFVASAMSSLLYASREWEEIEELA